MPDTDQYAPRLNGSSLSCAATDPAAVSDCDRKRLAIECFMEFPLGCFDVPIALPSPRATSLRVHRLGSPTP